MTVALGRLDRARKGSWCQLFAEADQEVPVPGKRGPRVSALTTDTRGFKELVLNLVEDGQLGKAAAALGSLGVHPLSKQILEELEAKHPRAQGNGLAWGGERPTLHTPLFNTDLICAVVRSFNLGSAPGGSGLRPGHLTDPMALPMGDVDHRLSEPLTRVCNILAGGKAPLQAAEWIAGAPLTPLKKRDLGVRPIAVGELMRRLVSRAFCLLPALKKRTQACFLELHQLGVGIRGGAEAAVQCVKMRLQLAGKNKERVAVLKLDFENAYNTISRQVILEELKADFPEVVPWFFFCYGQEAKLTCQGRILPFGSAQGVQQGDPLGPFLFSIAMRRCCKRLLAELPSSLSVWYLDDGTVVGSEEDVERAWEIVQEEAPRVGLKINAKKCEVWTSDGLECSFLPQDVCRSSPDGFELLGCPVGLPRFCHETVMRRVRKIADALERLDAINDPQVEYLLLRSCLGIPKLVFALRASPPSFIRQAARAFDELIVTTFGKRFSLDLSEQQWRQVGLPVRLGGLGLMKAEDLLEPCFLGSLITGQPAVAALLGVRVPTRCFEGAAEAFEDLRKRLPGVNGVPVTLEDLEAGCSGHPHAQRMLTAFVHERTQASLSGEEMSARDCLRLRAVCRENCGNWLNALPVESLGLKFAPWEFQVALKWWLGIPLFPKGAKCQLVSMEGRACGADLDEFGDHAVKCATGPTRIARHDGVNLAWFYIVRAAGFHPILEQHLDPDSKRRSADTFVPNWTAGSGCAHDWVIPHVMQNRALKHRNANPSEAVRVAEVRKKSGAAEECAKRGIDFLPLALDTFGGLGMLAMKAIRKVVAEMRVRRGKLSGISEGRITQRLRCAMLKGIVAQLLVREGPSPNAQMVGGSTRGRVSAIWVQERVTAARGGSGSWHGMAFPSASPWPFSKSGENTGHDQIQEKGKPAWLGPDWRSKLEGTGTSVFPTRALQIQVSGLQERKGNTSEWPAERENEAEEMCEALRRLHVGTEETLTNTQTGPSPTGDRLKGGKGRAEEAYQPLYGKHCGSEPESQQQWRPKGQPSQQTQLQKQQQGQGEAHVSPRTPRHLYRSQDRCLGLSVPLHHEQEALQREQTRLPKPQTQRQELPQVPQNEQQQRQSQAPLPALRAQQANPQESHWEESGGKDSNHSGARHSWSSHKLSSHFPSPPLCLHRPHASYTATQHHHHHLHTCPCQPYPHNPHPYLNLNPGPKPNPWPYHKNRNSSRNHPKYSRPSSFQPQPHPQPHPKPQPQPQPQLQLPQTLPSQPQPQGPVRDSDPPDPLVTPASASAPASIITPAAVIALTPAIALAAASPAQSQVQTPTPSPVLPQGPIATRTSTSQLSIPPSPLFPPPSIYNRKRSCWS